MISSTTWELVKDEVDSYFANPDFCQTENTITLITNNKNELVDKFFSCFNTYAFTTRLFRDGTFVLTITDMKIRLNIQIVVDRMICSKKSFQLKKLIDLQDYIKENEIHNLNIHEDEFFRLICGD